MEIIGSLGFSATGVEVATTFLSRARGLMWRRPVPLLLPTASVHGLGLWSQVWVVAIDGTGTVMEVRPIRRRLAWCRGARWILELPPGHARPVLGERLAFRRWDGEPESDAGTPIPLLDPDRQPR